MKLNQVIAIEKGTKTRTFSELSENHHNVQKTELLMGITRNYKPKDDDGDKLPSETTKVQVRSNDVIKRTCETLAKYFDITATKDWANCEAGANIMVDGKPLLENVPVTYLLFLEKQLTDIHTFIKKLPTLDPSETWRFDEAQDCWATEPTDTTKTKKVPRNHVKAPATDKHPAQVDVYHEDIVVGTWRTTKYSGALPATRVAELLERTEKLRDAVKVAREEANGQIAKEITVGKKIFDFLFQ